MTRSFTTTALVLAGLLSLTGCAAEAPVAGSPDEQGITDAGQESEATAVESDEAAEGSETTMPPGARPASADFPFPVPEGWPELDPFTEEKLGKNLAMSGSVIYPGDAQSAAATYQQLLQEAGFQIHPHPLGEQVNAASFIVTGRIDGVVYAGGLDFDTDFNGNQRVAINLVED